MEGSGTTPSAGVPTAPANSVQTVLEFWLDGNRRAFPRAADVISKAKAKLLIPAEEIDEVVSIVSAIVRSGENAARTGRIRRSRLVFWAIVGVLLWAAGVGAAFGVIDAVRSPGALEYVVFDFLVLLAMLILGIFSHKQSCRQETVVMLDQAKRVASMLSVWNKAKYLRFGFAFEEYSTKGLCLQAVAGGPSAEFCPAKALSEVSKLSNYGLTNVSKWKMASFGHSTEPPPQLMKAKSFQNPDDYDNWQTDEDRIRTGIRNSFEGDYAILLKYSIGFKRKPRTGDKDLIKSSLVSLRNKRDQSSIQRTPMGSKREPSAQSQIEKQFGSKNAKASRITPNMEKSEEIFILSGGDEPWEYAVPSEDVGSFQQNVSPDISESNRSVRNEFKLANPGMMAIENLAIPEVSHHSDEEFSAQSSVQKLRGPINSRGSQLSHNTQQDEDNQFADVEQHLNHHQYGSELHSTPRDEILSPQSPVEHSSPKLATHVEGRSSKTVIRMSIKPEVVDDEADWHPDQPTKEKETLPNSKNTSQKSSRTKIVTKDIMVESPRHVAAGVLPVPIEVRSKLKERSRDCSVDSNDSKPIPGGRASRDRSVDSNEAVRATRIVRTTSNEAKLNALSKPSSLKQLHKSIKPEEAVNHSQIEHKTDEITQKTSKLIDIEDFSAPK